MDVIFAASTAAAADSASWGWEVSWLWAWVVCYAWFLPAQAESETASIAASTKIFFFLIVLYPLLFLILLSCFCTKGWPFYTFLTIPARFSTTAGSR